MRQAVTSDVFRLSLSPLHIAGVSHVLGLSLTAVVVDILGMSRKREFELSVADVRIYAQYFV
jgi:hypothetical protein